MAYAKATDENFFIHKSCDDLNVDDYSNIDSSIVMSLLEDSQIWDEETPRIMNIPDSFSDSGDYCRFSEVDQLESCCSISPNHHLDCFEWTDMEDVAYNSYSSHEITSYLIGHDFAEKIEAMVDLNGLEDYSQVCYGVPMEEEDDYIGLWQ